MSWWKQWDSWKKDEFLKGHPFDSTDAATLGFYFRFYTKFKIDAGFWQRKLNEELEKMNVENQDLFLDRLGIIDVAVHYVCQEMAKEKAGK